MLFYLILFHVFSFQDLGATTNQTLLNFDIILKGKIVGQLQASKSFKDSKMHYQSKTDISTRFIKEIHVNYKYHVVFSNNKLQESDVNVVVNNKPHAETKIEREQNHYLVKQEKKEARVFKEAINYSTILLYFEEPKNIKHCFSEEEGKMNTIVPLGNHTYKKVNARGNESIYYYENGKLIKAEIDGGLIKFQIQAK
ncbi:hypothetical protein DFR65_10158 [Oceanihabitans sediminis]|uniref:Uncharacterized protein n=1 Tax=Oceanihabitans sediminis TaxID=1812012 RepID=A0A368P5Y8_9FLAO|nr:DUF6134 family protein [Oceanihabitans sediminis]RBP34175.1 hypothetical protein DFR65_10158 [Oceanihabitans sediminis]RCU57866.1 hypothetical protein DU428_00285 [Oceanihabitans sediminis]